MNLPFSISAAQVRSLEIRRFPVERSRRGAEAMAPRRIVALRHMSGDGAIKRRRVVIAAHPVAALSPLEVIVFGWWRRRGRGRPAGLAGGSRG